MQAPPETRLDAIVLVQRMVGNGLTANESELNTIIQYLVATYVKKSLQPGQQKSDSGATNIEGMETYANRHCIDCHGSGGKHPVQPVYPVLAGQNKEYLLRQFKDIKDGIRNNSLTAMMRAIVQDVSDTEIEVIADYLSSQ
jgi:cytochrome c